MSYVFLAWSITPEYVNSSTCCNFSRSIFMFSCALSFPMAITLVFSVLIFIRIFLQFSIHQHSSDNMVFSAGRTADATEATLNGNRVRWLTMLTTTIRSRSELANRYSCLWVMDRTISTISTLSTLLCTVLHDTACTTGVNSWSQIRTSLAVSVRPSATLVSCIKTATPIDLINVHNKI